MGILFEPSLEVVVLKLKKCLTHHWIANFKQISDLLLAFLQLDYFERKLG
jgi:hypothetical protein